MPLVKPHAIALLFCAVGMPLSLHAQDTPSSRPYSWQPYVSVGETVSDNANLSATDHRTDFISRGTLGVRADANSGALRGYLDYSLSGLLYARGTGGDELQNNLSAFGTAELVEQRAYVDVAASISQQVLSPFGTRSVDPSLANANRNEVASYTLSPYLRGRLAGAADYELRATYAGVHSRDSGASDSRTGSVQASFVGATALAKLGWSALLDHSEADYSAGRRTEEEVARGVLSWALTPELSLSGIGGVEANNYLSVDKESHRRYGAGATWHPSERTTLSATREHRFFGESHNVSFTWRTPRTVWSFSDVRDVVTTPNLPVVGSLGTAFDLFFRQFESAVPDPVMRRQFVYSFLQAVGIDPNRQLLATFLSSAVTLQRMQMLSFALLGLRDTWTASLGQSQSSRLDILSLGQDAFSTSSLIRQRAVSLAWSHKLTPQSSLSVAADYSRTTGALVSQATTLESLSLLWSAKLGYRTDGSFGARHSHFGSASSPYDETAVFGTVTLRF